MADHTPTPWKTDGVYLVAPFGPTIADCKKSSAIDVGTARANAAFIVKCVNSHDALVKALEGLLDDHDRLYVYRVEEARTVLASIKEAV